MIHILTSVTPLLSKQAKFTIVPVFKNCAFAISCEFKHQPASQSELSYLYIADANAEP